MPSVLVELGLAELGHRELPPDPAATERMGEALGRRLRPGDAVALVGELGAGKTALAKGLGRGLGVDDADAIASPTYLVVVEHAGPVRMLHADAYLPQKLAAFLQDGGLEYLTAPDAVAVVEWADRVAKALPARTLWVRLSPTAAGGRRLEFACRDPRDFPWTAAVGENRAGE